jgi:hypothetical protein
MEDGVVDVPGLVRILSSKLIEVAKKGNSLKMAGKAIENEI